MAPYFTQLLREKKDPPPELGGEELMSKLKKNCLRGDTINLTVEVYYYRMRKKYECIND